MRDKKGRFIKGHEVPREWIQKCKQKNKWQRGKERYNWKGITYQKGRRFINIDGERLRYSHYIWIQENKMPIPKGFVIHHRNCDKLNDDINNLVLLPRDIHLLVHNPLQHRWGDLNG